MVSESTRRGTVSHIVAGIFAVALAVTTTIGTIPWWVAVLYAVASLVSKCATVHVNYLCLERIVSGITCEFFDALGLGVWLR
ncbi:hypothetical protein FB472_0301 [Rhodoglobus vestalii]|uniref:Uncharacterized protein n=1 Tax=Rhodoglobus vestalii TaxID=193384 RepID=A0A8H2K2A5_9MICO|nr:hypothetical protein [Rhodoglobus vestalii]TQO18780.1 hypothetical protein FB472_0301 [Rhodoglobus vestalii]